MAKLDGKWIENGTVKGSKLDSSSSFNMGELNVRGIASVGNIVVGGSTGLIGSTGIQGLTGVQGEKGSTGPFGLTGIQGITGIHGLTGIQGVTGPFGGPQGETGVKGVTGPVGGPQGPTGAQGLTGRQGLTGIQGLTGMTGAQGVTGLQGPIGLTGAGLQGTTGTQGATGIQGIQGEKGSTGIQGKGVTGLRGITGLQGSQGTTGTKGFTGIQGWTGLQGPTGVYGKTGLQGVTGVSSSIGGYIIVPVPTGNATTDTNNIQNAINQAYNNGGGTVLLQQGLYMIARTDGSYVDALSVTHYFSYGILMKRSVHLVGCSIEGTKLRPNTSGVSSSQPFEIIRYDTMSTIATTIRNIRIENDTNYKNYITGIKIGNDLSAYDPQPVLVENVCIRKCDTGIIVASWFARITSCWIRFCKIGIDITHTCWDNPPVYSDPGESNNICVCYNHIWGSPGDSNPPDEMTVGILVRGNSCHIEGNVIGNIYSGGTGGTGRGVYVTGPAILGTHFITGNHIQTHDVSSGTIYGVDLQTRGNTLVANSFDFKNVASSIEINLNNDDSQTFLGNYQRRTNTDLNDRISGNIKFDRGHLKLLPRTTPVPAAPTLSDLGSGTGVLAAGTYKYRISFYDDEGETIGGTEATITLPTANRGVRLTNIPTAGGFNGRRIYRSAVNSTELRRVVTIDAASTTTYDDTTTTDDNLKAHRVVPRIDMRADSFFAGGKRRLQLNQIYAPFPENDNSVDRANIQDTIDSLPGDGGTVFLGPGIYRIAKTPGQDYGLLIPDGVKLVGNSTIGTVLMPTNNGVSTSQPFDIIRLDQYRNPPSFPNVTIKDLSIRNHYGNTHVLGINLGNYSSNNPPQPVLLENVYVLNCEWGIRVMSWFAELHHCKIEECTTGIDLQYYKSAPPSTPVYGNTNATGIYHCKIWGVTTGIKVDGIGNQIIGCNIGKIASSGYGVHLTAGAGVGNSIIGCYIESTNSVSAGIRVSTEGNTLTGNYFDLSSGSEISIDSGKENGNVTLGNYSRWSPNALTSEIYTPLEIIPGTISDSNPNIRLKGVTSSVPSGGNDGDIQIYESGSTRRFYIKINGSWRYAGLS